MKNQKTIKICLWTAFSVYCLVLAFYLFVSRVGGSPYGTFAEYVKYSFNPIPFKTMWELVAQCVIRGSWFIPIAVRNIAGNIALFFPMGILLPFLFPKMRSFRRILLIAICTTLCVELAQLFLRCGICDVDDVILNVAGWLLGFAVLKIPFINRILNRVI